MRHNLKDKGITLVALVVTIIILLILAGITVSLVIGQNGLLGKAQLASNTMANATANETTQMAKYSNDIDDLTSGFINGQGGGGGPTIVGDAPQVGESINYNAGSLTTTTASLNLPEGTSIEGKKLASLNLHTGTSLLNEIDASLATDWVVLDYDSTTGEVLIVPTTYDTDRLQIEGIQGYNNAVEAFDMVAGIYLNPTYAKNARSITVEDVNKLEGYDPVVRAAAETVTSTGTGAGGAYVWSNRYGMNADTLKIIDYGEGNIENRTFKTTPTTDMYTYELSEKAVSIFGTDQIWLASRLASLDGDEQFDFGVRAIDHGYNDQTSWPRVGRRQLISLGENNYFYSSYSAMKVLPVVSLKSNVTMQKVNGVWQLSVD